MEEGFLEKETKSEVGIGGGGYHVEEYLEEVVGVLLWVFGSKARSGLKELSIGLKVVCR